MKSARRRESGAGSETTRVLLRELRDECERVISLIHRLEVASLSEKDRDDVLGDLSAAVLHLHAHTEGLDEFLCERA